MSHLVIESYRIVPKDKPEAGYSVYLNKAINLVPNVTEVLKHKAYDPVSGSYDVEFTSHFNLAHGRLEFDWTQTNSVNVNNLPFFVTDVKIILNAESNIKTENDGIVAHGEPEHRMIFILDGNNKKKERRCEVCDYKVNFNQEGWCYMFEEKMDNCGQFKQPRAI